MTEETTLQEQNEGSNDPFTRSSSIPKTVMGRSARVAALLVALFGVYISSFSDLPPPSDGPAAFATASQRTEETLRMFRRAYDDYMEYAFPQDDLQPLTCSGSSPHGGIAITLLDSLDTLLVMNETVKLQHAVTWVEEHASSLFDVDDRVHVFELTIRALGGLLSAHSLLTQNGIVPGYNGTLLMAAVNLADRLLPAFETGTGIPLSWVNLHSGQIPGDTRVTCAACATTLVLEFGVLSRLTGISTYEDLTKHAIKQIAAKMGQRGVPGNTIHVDTGKWMRKDSGVGAGIDSYYEYLLKVRGSRSQDICLSYGQKENITRGPSLRLKSVMQAYLAFGDEEYLDLFTESYTAAMMSMQLSPSLNGFDWLVDVHMNSGRVLHPYISSLSAFWPALQVLAGQNNEAATLHSSWVKAWNRFGWTPEMFHFQLVEQHPTQAGYPLRPELVESTFFLYAATNNPDYLEFGLAFQERLQKFNHALCGYAAVADVSTGRLDNSMESFFLSETLKYLYLLFSNATGILDNYILSTEGHILPLFEASNSSSTGYKEEAGPAVQNKCQHLCDYSYSQLTQSREALRIALPWLPLPSIDTSHLLLKRRCTACKAVTASMDRARQARVLSEANNMTGIDRGFVCPLVEVPTGRLACAFVREVPVSELSSQALQALPQNFILLLMVPGNQTYDEQQVWTRFASSLVSIEALPAMESLEASAANIVGVLADFGAEFVPGCDSRSANYSKLLEDWQHSRLLEWQAWREELAQQQAEDDEYEDEYEEAVPQERSHQAQPTPDTQRNAVCDIRGSLAVAEPDDACQSLANAHVVANNVAIVKRGECAFIDKARNAQAAGAVAIVVVNTDDQLMVMTGEREQIRIPAVFIGAAEGTRLTESASKGPVDVTITFPPTQERWQLAQQLAQDQMTGEDVCPVDPTPTFQLLIPPNSQSFVMQQIYDQQKDMSLVIQAVTAHAL